MNNNDTSNFLDRRTLTAIFLVFATWMGWQYYMSKKYPQLFEKKAPVTTAMPAPDAAKSATPAAAIPAPEVAPAAATVPAAAMAEKTIDFKSDEFSFKISSKGMSIRNLTLLKYTDRKNQPVEFARKTPPYSFETRLMNASEPIDFAIEQTSDHSWIGRAQVGGLAITKTLEVNPAQYSFDVKVGVQGQDPKFAGLTTSLSDIVDPPASGSNFLNRNYYDRQDAFVDTPESHNNHIYFGNDVIDKTWPSAHVVSLGSSFFTQAIVDHSSVIPEVKVHVDPSNHSGTVQLTHAVLNRSGNFDVHYTGFVGPKSMALLKSIDEDLVPVIDFGFFSTIGRYLLVVLKWFHSLISNWGVAIILLTLAVRLIVLPFNIMSYRSMKAMQVLQPKMKAVREKYKDDSQKQNQEVMLLMRENKVNPVGGCLPMILQLPIFWAFYQVLGRSIELYQAPFLWIHDLSLKDPFYALPIAMGISMFLQQKITPTTMDPAQAKIMMFMPLMFSIFMFSLPAGLTLYIFVSSLFAVIQQFYFMRSHNRLVEAR